MDKQLIFTRLDHIEQTKAEISKNKELLDSILENDNQLCELKKTSDCARKDFSIHREMLMNEPDAARLSKNIKELKQDLKDLKDLMSSDMLYYFVETKEFSIEDTCGNKVEMSFSGKIKKDGESI